MADGSGLMARVSLDTRRVRLAAAILDDFALEDPDLHTDGAEGGLRRRRRVVDIRAQRVQRHPTLVVAFDPRDLGAAETPARLHLDALRAHKAFTKKGEPAKNPPNFTELTTEPLLKDKTPQEQLETVVDLFKKQYGEEWFKAFDEIATLLWIRRKDALTYKDCNLFNVELVKG